MLYLLRSHASWHLHLLHSLDGARLLETVGLTFRFDCCSAIGEVHILLSLPQLRLRVINIALKYLLVYEILTFEKCIQLFLEKLPLIEQTLDAFGSKLPAFKDFGILLSEVLVPLLELVVLEVDVFLWAIFLALFLLLLLL